MADLRPTLEAIAAGHSTQRNAATVLASAQVEDHADAFRAWAVFANNDGREPLAAPTAILTPLP